MEYIRDKYNKGIEAGFCTMLLITKGSENISCTKALFITLSVLPIALFSSRSLAFHFSIRITLSPPTSTLHKIKIIIFNNQQIAPMKLLPRFFAESFGSILSPRKKKDKDVGKDIAAPTVSAGGKDIPSPGVSGISSDIPSLSVPAIGDNIPIPSNTSLDKDIPTPSAAGAAKGTPASPTAGADSTTNGNASPSTVTTSITVSVTDTSTVTSATATFTVIQHDLATVATTAPTTVTVLHHDLATVSITVPTTIVTTHLVTPSTKPIKAAHTTAAFLPAGSAVPTAKKHAEPALIVSIIFGLIIMGLLGVIFFLIVRLRRMAKAKTTVGMKTYAEEFDWPQPRPVESDDIKRKDEWGLKQKEMWGLS